VALFAAGKQTGTFIWKCGVYLCILWCVETFQQSGIMLFSVARMGQAREMKPFSQKSMAEEDVHGSFNSLWLVLMLFDITAL
jgi:hypothetical protein